MDLVAIMIIHKLLKIFSRLVHGSTNWPNLTHPLFLTALTLRMFFHFSSLGKKKKYGNRDHT